MSEADPSWDAETRERVQRAMNQVMFTARDVLMRYADEDCFYVPPSEVSDAGDVTGLINAGRHQVIRRLQEEIDRAQATMDAVIGDIDDHRREFLGQDYRSPRVPRSD
ncbi:hypothetical protein O7626_35220 [Micromonospora sp. WMMD1102]|uniref:hypothetical protein n=1 Tax=Micromonosporaceae TaxID=28056 RepID=UPI00241501E3|nr:hypothetical protein [Micromonospora sp. WMMD1102]MDG4791099.1 hypothetical protein [Micromonospora sp. WMMD1102]